MDSEFTFAIPVFIIPEIYFSIYFFVHTFKLRSFRRAVRKQISISPWTQLLLINNRCQKPSFAWFDYPVSRLKPISEV